MIDVAGLDYINNFTRALGLEQTWLAANLQQTLDDIAREAGFTDYQSLTAHEPGRDGPPAWGEVSRRIESSVGLDPIFGSRTTPHEMATLLQALWLSLIHILPVVLVFESPHPVPRRGEPQDAREE